VFMCMIFIEKCEINYASKTTEEGQWMGEPAFMFNRVCEHVSDLRN
jgi:hypothetical protein